MLEYIRELLRASVSVLVRADTYWIAPDNVPRVYRFERLIGYGMNALLMALNRRVDWEQIKQIILTKPEYDSIVVANKLPYDLVRMLPADKFQDAIHYAALMIGEWIQNGIIAVLGYPPLELRHSRGEARH